MNNDIKFLNIEWGTQYSLTHFEEHFGLHGSVIFLDPNMCGSWCIYYVYCFDPNFLSQQLISRNSIEIISDWCMTILKFTVPLPESISMWRNTAIIGTLCSLPLITSSTFNMPWLVYATCSSSLELSQVALKALILWVLDKMDAVLWAAFSN